MKRRLLLAAPLVMAAAPRVPLAATPISRMDTAWWAQRHAAKLRELHGAPPGLLWLGDSITHDWEKAGPSAALNFAPVWQRFYGGRAAVNLGFKGDATSHLLWRLGNGQLDAIAPKAAVMLIGANNIGRARWSAADSVAGIEACLGEIRRRTPRTKVLLLSVLPSDRGAWTAQATLAINRGLAERYAAGSSATIRFLDVTDMFMRDGVIDRSQFYDGQLNPPEPALHPSAQAHARLAARIEPTLAELLGDTPRV